MLSTVIDANSNYLFRQYVQGDNVHESPQKDTEISIETKRKCWLSDVLRLRPPSACLRSILLVTRTNLSVFSHLPRGNSALLSKRPGDLPPLHGSPEKRTNQGYQDLH